MKKIQRLAPVAFLLCSCSLLDPDPGTGAKSSVDDVPHEMIVLGDQLDDPYSVENIEAAITKAYPTKAGRVVVKPTDIYVRFLPKTEAEYDRLVALGINLIDHPLDYEIVREGDYYHDPTLRDNEITWQYAVMKADSEMPKGIRTEVLDECYIAENDAVTRAGDIDWELVEREAFILTGNEGLLQTDTKGKSGGTAPSGRITILDDRLGEREGVAGVKVSCNTFVKFAHAYTDEDGCYKMDKTFSSDARFRIVFQNEKGFAIGLNKILVPASTSTLGKNGPEGVDVDIDRTSDRRLFSRCVVNNAAYDYFRQCGREGLEISTPPANTRIWLFQFLEASSALMLQQGVMIDDTAVGNFLGDYAKYVKMFLPDITLGVDGLEDYSSIYGQVVHELAHGSHFATVGKDYWNKYVSYVMESFAGSGGRLYGVGEGNNAGYCEVGEMWAFYIQNLLYKERYGDESATFGTSYWFHPHIFLYLDERGVDRSMIFKSLVPGATSRLALMSQLETLYPDNAVVIRQAFDRY